MSRGAGRRANLHSPGAPASTPVSPAGDALVLRERTVEFRRKRPLMDVADLRILVVEDHDFQRQFLERMLRELGARHLLSAANGRAALELLQAQEGGVDVLITDLDMPDMDGMELIRHVASGGHAAALIVASAMERALITAVEAMAAAYGMHLLGFMEKPVTPQKLQQLISSFTPRVVARQPPPDSSFGIERILEALRRDEFEPFFQPQVHVHGGKVAGVEALARWRHPQRGIVAPYAFIKPLEEAGAIDELLWCILRKSAAFSRTLRDEGFACMVSVNVSLKCLHDLAIGDRIAAIVADEHVTPSALVLEITESATTTELGKVLENLSRLRMKGFELSIDDYGTGYSSLEQLARIPFTEVKIDQAFVTHAGQRAPAKVILASSLAMARRLRLRAVAEGVETQANWELLSELKCEIAQGYYIGRPMSGPDCLRWMRERPLLSH